MALLFCCGDAGSVKIGVFCLLDLEGRLSLLVFVSTPGFVSLPVGLAGLAELVLKVGFVTILAEVVSDSGGKTVLDSNLPISLIVEMGNGASDVVLVVLQQCGSCSELSVVPMQHQLFSAQRST